MWHEWLDNNAVTISVIASVVALLFIIIGHAYRERVQLLLKGSLIKLPATTFDWWSASHLILFAIFGFLLPNHHFKFLLIGASFEVFEDMLSSDATTQLDDCTTSQKHKKLMCRFSINDDYWYAKWDDVFVNLLGYTIGSSVRTTFFDP